MAPAIHSRTLNEKPAPRYIYSMNSIPFRLTAGAARRVAEILSSDPAARALRVEVLAGGCSGFQYKFDLTAAQNPDDLVIAADGATVFVDPSSLDLLAGSELDYKDTLMGAHFAVQNPNATSSCGCGTSFSID
jgi:iron-sulfur cluster assembly accessory protein